MRSIRDFTTRVEPASKIIFLGDCVDYGPSSKEVVELISRLDCPWVGLRGDHEDMALRFAERGRSASSDDVWLRNGGAETLESYRDFPAASTGATDRGRDELNASPPEPPKKLIDFIKSLKRSHREDFNVRGGNKLRFTFTNKPPKWIRSPNERRESSVADRQDDPAELSKSGDESVPSKDRRRSSRAEVIVHCRTPAVHNWDFRAEIKGGDPSALPPIPYDDYRDRGILRDPAALSRRPLPRGVSEHLWWPALFSRYPKARLLGYRDMDGESKKARARAAKTWYWSNPGPLRGGVRDFKTDKGPGLEAINLNTGAAHGGAVTALGLTSDFIDLGYLVLLTERVCSDRRSDDDFKLRFIRLDRFGELPAFVRN
jgi:hypothetical protein